MLPEFVPPLVSNSRSKAPLDDILPEAAPLPTDISPVPLGVKEIFPFTPSVIVIRPEFVPLLVSNVKS